MINLLTCIVFLLVSSTTNSVSFKYSANPGVYPIEIHGNIIGNSTPVIFRDTLEAFQGIRIGGLEPSTSYWYRVYVCNEEIPSYEDTITTKCKTVDSVWVIERGEYTTVKWTIDSTAGRYVCRWPLGTRLRLNQCNTYLTNKDSNDFYLPKGRYQVSVANWCDIYQAERSDFSRRDTFKIY